MKLVHVTSGREIKVGSIVIAKGGKTARVVSIREPQKPNAKGKVFVEMVDGTRDGFTPDVFGAAFE